MHLDDEKCRLAYLVLQQEMYSIVSLTPKTTIIISMFFPIYITAYQMDL